MSLFYILFNTKVRYVKKMCISFKELAPLWKLMSQRRDTCCAGGFDMVCKSGLLLTHSTLPPQL